MPRLEQNNLAVSAMPTHPPTPREAEQAAEIARRERNRQEVGGCIVCGGPCPPTHCQGLGPDSWD